MIKIFRSSIPLSRTKKRRQADGNEHNVVVPDNDVNDHYCGVYEHMMEQQLDDIEPDLHDELVFENDTGTNNNWCDSFDDYISDCSVSLSDEHAIHNTI